MRFKALDRKYEKMYCRMLMKVRDRHAKMSRKEVIILHMNDSNDLFSTIAMGQR